MADAQVSGTCGGNTIWVQLPSLAPVKNMVEPTGSTFLFKFLARFLDFENFSFYNRIKFTK